MSCVVYLGIELQFLWLDKDIECSYTVQKETRHRFSKRCTLSTEPCLDVTRQASTVGGEDALCWTFRMPVQLSTASPADSVMTRLWSHSARLHPQIYQARTRINSTSSSLKAASWSPTQKSLSSSSSLRRSSQLSPHPATSPSLIGTSRVISQGRNGRLNDREDERGREGD